MFTPLITCHLPAPFDHYVLAFGDLKSGRNSPAIGAIRLFSPQGELLPMEMRMKKVLRQVNEKLELQVPLIHPNTGRNYTTTELGRKILKALESRDYAIQRFDKRKSRRPALLSWA